LPASFRLWTTAKMVSHLTCKLNIGVVTKSTSMACSFSPSIHRCLGPQSVLARCRNGVFLVEVSKWRTAQNVGSSSEQGSTR
jgi:hypothetical protein